jgi:ABC-type proline/glycine betaine transport system permease subunit
LPYEILAEITTNIAEHFDSIIKTFQEWIDIVLIVNDYIEQSVYAIIMRILRIVYVTIIVVYKTVKIVIFCIVLFIVVKFFNIDKKGKD